jgi:hypothetical protein
MSNFSLPSFSDSMEAICPSPKRHGNRPYVIGNFVETIDGVVSFGIPGRSGGRETRGGSDEDRFVMGLLRSVSDAVLVGSRTFNEGVRAHAHSHIHLS